MLEFTDSVMRVFGSDGALVTVPNGIATSDAVTMTGVITAATGIISVSDATKLSDSYPVIITGAVGIPAINGRIFRMTKTGGNNVQLTDYVRGTTVVMTGWGTYTSGGTLRVVSHIASPYLAAEISDIQYAQYDTTMYLTHPNHTPRKLTLDSGGTWALNAVSFTDTPFAAGAVLVITGITKATQGVVTFAAGSVVNENVVYAFAAVVGMTEVNGVSYQLEIIENTGGAVKAYLLHSTTRAYIDTTGFTTYTSDGTATPAVDNPVGVTFYEGRLWYVGTNQRPNILMGSRSPVSTTGAARYDIFTGGADADHACFFAIAPTNGMIPTCVWGVGTPEFLAVGTLGGPFAVTGGGLGEPITPSSISVKQVDAYGCAAIMPASGGGRVAFIQRGGKAVRMFAYDSSSATYATRDLTLNAEHIGERGFVRLAFQAGRPDVLWAVMDDGTMAACSVHASENVTGWHRHMLGGVGSGAEDFAVLPRADDADALWAVGKHYEYLNDLAEGGQLARSVLRMADVPVFYDPEDFYDLPGISGGTKAVDWPRYLNSIWRQQAECVHTDFCQTYDGSDRGVDAGANLSFSALTVGTGRTCTASASVFLAGDVGSEIWVKADPQTGLGTGRATITAYTNPTTVTVEITERIYIYSGLQVSTSVLAGDWYFAVVEITIPALFPTAGVGALADGDATVANGASVGSGVWSVSPRFAVLHVGATYAGFLQTHNLELGGRTGPAQAKPRNIVALALRLLHTLGVKFGTDPYELTDASYPTEALLASNRPDPVFSGIRKLPYEDDWSTEGEKFVVVKQEDPYPCVVQFIDIEYATGDEE